MLGNPIPILRSFDEKRAKDFYLGFLGFELVFEARVEDRSPLYMGVKKGDCILHLSEHYGDGSPGAAMRIPIGNVGAYMAELRAKKFGNAHPGEPQETPWGTCEITIADPASNKLTFYSVTDSRTKH